MSVKRLTRDYSQETKNVKIAMNKSLLKEFYKDGERVVYLNDGDEFQIQIFNDKDTEIGAKITVNGEMIGNAYLVIRPGERVWLDRYLNVARKLKFVTYEVNGNNEQVQKAIQNNGIVKVELYRKKHNYGYDWCQPLLKTWQDPIPYDYPHIYYSNEPYATCTASVDNISGTMNYCSSLADTNLSCDSISTSSTTAASSTYTIGSTSTCTNTPGKARSRSFSKSLNSNKIETGRIQEGGYSDQDFEYVNMSFESWSFRTEQIHILPKSVKPVYSNELQKTYCYNCGRKLKSKFNFCPFCGAKL